MTVAPLAASDPPSNVWWRVELWNRYPAGGQVATLPDVRSRDLHMYLWDAATFDFVIDGNSPQAIQLKELTQDVVVYRWDPVNLVYVCYFRGPIARIEDQLSETVHTVTVHCADYRAMFGRRVIAAPGQVYDPALGVTPTIDQANMVKLNVNQTQTGKHNMGVTWGGVRNPDSSYRSDADTATQRQRIVYGGEQIDANITALGNCDGGFEWGVEPNDPLANAQPGVAWVWFPTRGVVKPFVAEYGVTVTSLTRTFATADYANYIRVSGASITPMNVSGQPATTVPIFSAKSVADASVGPEGYWDTAASYPESNLQTSLDETAVGLVDIHSTADPSFTFNIIPGRWRNRADFWLGDTIEIRVDSGRLHVEDAVRVVEMEFNVDDDGSEALAITTARPDTQFADMFQAHSRSIAALARR
jgi:hypothetical protein